MRTIFGTALLAGLLANTTQAILLSDEELSSIEAYAAKDCTGDFDNIEMNDTFSVCRAKFCTKIGSAKVPVGSYLTIFYTIAGVVSDDGWESPT